MRWAVPGDHAVVDDDGTITLLGRGSVSINTGGEKVYPEEVESVLKSHPSVFDAVVVGVPDDRWGERVVAVVAAPGHDTAVPTLDALQQFTPATHLAGYKVPRGLVSSTRSSDRRRASPTTAGPRSTRRGRGGYGRHVNEPARRRDEPVPPPARRQSRRLVSVGRRRVRRWHETRDVPLFFSVGYSSCHWCHVMAHESFEDEATADVMNRLFVNVKVDREERPDVDADLHAVGAGTDRAAAAGP